MGLLIDKAIVVIIIVCFLLISIHFFLSVNSFFVLNESCVVKTQNYLSSPFQANPYNLDFDSKLKISSDLNIS